MGKTTTFNGRIRSRGGRVAATPAPVLHTVIGSFDPTAASAPMRVGMSASSGPQLVLPKGAKVLYALPISFAAGGTNPTIDIGTAADSAFFFNEMDADSSTAITNVSGAHSVLRLTTGLADDTVVYGGVGASAATGGTSSIAIVFLCHDDGKTESAV